MKREINYIKSTFLSTPNLVFIGIMAFLMLVLSNPGFIFLLLAGELATFVLSQTSFVQNIIRARAEKQWRLEQEAAEQRVVMTVTDNYKADFFRVRQLCEEIERRASETTENQDIQHGNGRAHRQALQFPHGIYSNASRAYAACPSQLQGTATQT
jgi:hypothetical protein